MRVRNLLSFPLHFWLPGAMAAPTPVSAYLHSATMVKAGVFLLARVFPVLAVLPIWAPTLVGFGATTMVLGAYLALRSAELKKIFCIHNGVAARFAGVCVRAWSVLSTRTRGTGSRT